MRNIIALSILIFFSSVMLAQEASTENVYSLEIWEADISSKDGFYTLNIGIYNNGAPFGNPVIQAFYKDIIIANVEQVADDVILKRNSIHQVSLPIEIPNNYKGKKIKLEISISNGIHTMKEKLKVAIGK